jgi:hypothetical protein
MLPHIMPVCRFLLAGDPKAVMPGNETVEIKAEAMAVFFVNCRLFMLC